jgi:hypothetical protein
MAGPYTYPGVYVEEVPSGVRTIIGVSTSDTAFIDVFARGPLDRAVRITSFGDFERVFGGLDSASAASYGVRQFFLNGGGVAWVVRVGANGTAASKTLSGATPPEDVVRVDAASPGAWGRRLGVAIDHKTRDPTRLFNLAVREVVTIAGRDQVVATEGHRNLSVDPADARYAVDVVNTQSSLIRLTDLGTGELPAPTGTGADIDVIGDPKAADFKPLDSAGAEGDLPGSTAWEASGPAAILGSESQKTGIFALDAIAPFVFNVLCIPAAADLPAAAMRSVVTGATAYCRGKRAFLLVDIPDAVTTAAQMQAWMADNDALRSEHAAVYYPRVLVSDPLNGNRLRNAAASGTVAGVYARTDAARGVWKAPAGTDADLRGATLADQITDGENGALNQIGINALRTFPIFGNIVWGARTLDGADQQASEWKYIPVRRTALFIEESLAQGLKWVVFEPNDEPLWAQIRLNVGAFMQNLFRQGAFQGITPREAYFVKCDRETTTQNDINSGIVNILVGFAPLKPAEFVVIKIQQMAGQVQV